MEVRYGSFIKLIIHKNFITHIMHIHLLYYEYMDYDSIAL